MRRIIEITDPYFIKTVLNINDTYSQIAYDNSPTLEHFKPAGVWILLIDGDDIAGFVNFLPMNNIMWSPHICIFELYRGNGSEEWGKQAIEYMKEKYNAKKFLALTPYLIAKKYAERVGFDFLMRLKNSIKKNNQILDQYVLEMN